MTSIRYTQGLTLMELMIVMAIIAIASAVIIPRIGNSDAKLYRVQLRTLSAALNYNRRNAVVMNRPFELTLFPAAANDMDLENTKKVQLGDWVSQGANIQWLSGTLNIRNKKFTITYFPQGGATGGTIKLQQGRYIARLSIDGITAKVTTIEEISDDDPDS